MSEVTKLKKQVNKALEASEALEAANELRAKR
jgi:hypothetical protein